VVFRIFIWRVANPSHMQYAQYGEDLNPSDRGIPPLCKMDATPPITTGFFNGNFFTPIGYHPEDAEKDFSEDFVSIRWLKQIGKDAPVGEGTWNTIDLEEILDRTYLFDVSVSNRFYA